MVAALKKEIQKSQTDTGEKAGEYRQMLVQAVHRCAVRFPGVAGAVVNLLMDFLGDANTGTAFDVAMFVREIAQTNPDLRDQILRQMLDCFFSIRSSRVCGTCLWIVGEFSLMTAQIEESLETLKQSLGPTPFFTQKKKHSQWEADPEEDDQATRDQYGKRHFGEASHDSMKEQKKKGPVVLADGSYATQTASSADVRALAEAQVPNLRALVLAGDFFLASVVSTTLTKLAMRYINIAADAGVAPADANRLHAECMLYIVCMIRLGESGETPTPMDSDSNDRMMVCIKTLAKPQEADVDVWLSACRSAYDGLIADRAKQKEDEEAEKDQRPISQADDLIDFYHLKSRKGMSQVEIEDAVATDLKRATGFGAGKDEKKSALERVIQLTGFSDPVYAGVRHRAPVRHRDGRDGGQQDERGAAESRVGAGHMGDLKLVERPQNHTLGPGETKHIRANIKVSSTETGVIFGNIVYESTGSDRNVVVLNDVHIDIMDYISPAWCEDNKFRSMWAEFEWENKVAVNTTIKTVREFLDHIVESTNMRCLTPPSALEGDCGYLAANLYAKSVFGEDALVNVSVEEQDGVVSGFIRIRSKTQGIALSLGDKITLKQRAKAVPK